MRILVTGSSGQLGVALMRVLRAGGEHDAIGLDLKPAPYTALTGSIADAAVVARAMEGQSELARAVGAKGYHDAPFGVYTA